MREPTLVERLERVERENRFWKVIGISVMTLMAPALLMGATKPGVQNEIRARRFTLVNDEGKIRGFLGFSAIGSPTLFLFDNPTVTLFDSERRPRARLTGGSIESGLRLYGKDGNPVIDLYAESGEWPRVSLFDKSQRRRAVLQVLPDGSPRSEFRDTGGKIIWSAP